jgi:hypothetical protein
VDAGYQWLTDHGAVMYTAARHAMLTGDQRFIEKWTPALLKGYEFIRDARRLPRNPPQVQGIMPAASASDKKDPLQSFWSDGWNYKGLAETARVLDLCNHPRAAEVQREADEYRAAIVAALRSKAARMPKWKDRCGRDRTIVPMALSADDSNGYGIEHPFYLDTGPMFGVYASLLPADDTLMQDAADFFRGGPHTADPDATFLWTRTARLIHEMSSAEPCYSWNVFHTHQLGDRQRFLEGMYSLFTGAMSRQTFVSCETRDGITATVFANPLACYLARLAVIDDELERGKLHLLRLVPLAWLSDSQQTVFQNMPTEFGPVTLKWMLRDAGRTLDLTCTARFRRRPDAVVLHAPPLPHLEKVVINNESGSARAGQQFLLRPQSLGS